MEIFQAPEKVFQYRIIQLHFELFQAKAGEELQPKDSR
jgi:hypothetical protein